MMKNYQYKTLPNEQDFFSKEINVFNNSHGAAVYTGCLDLCADTAVSRVPQELQKFVLSL